MGQQDTEAGETRLGAGEGGSKALRPGEQGWVGGVLSGLFQRLDPLPQHRGLLARRMNHLFESGRQLCSRLGTQPVVGLVQMMPTPLSVLPPTRLGKSFLHGGAPGGMDVGESQMRGCPALGE